MFMAYSINKVTLVGNVGNEPEVKTFQNGNRVVNFSLATSERWKDKETGEPKTNTEWHKIAIFNTLFVELAEKYIKKGSKVYLEGQLQTRKWQDNNGIEKYTTEIVLLNYRGELVLLDRASENNSLQSIESQTEVVKETQNPSKKQNINEIDSLEDDIPF